VSPKQPNAGAGKLSFSAKASASGKWISSKKSKELKVRSGKEVVKRVSRTLASKEAADYTDNGTPSEHCSICEHFMLPRNCTKVQGNISPKGWCMYWTKQKPRYSSGVGHPQRKIRD